MDGLVDEIPDFRAAGIAPAIEPFLVFLDLAHSL